MRCSILFTLFSVLAVSSAQADVTLSDEEIMVFAPVNAQYESVALSPDGQRVAATVQIDRDFNLVIMDVSEPRQPKVTYQGQPPRNESINEIRWISNERLLYWTTLTRTGQNEEQLSANVYAINFDGKRSGQLMGPAAGPSYFLPTDIIDTLPEDKYRILVRTRSLLNDRSQVFEELNVFTAKHRVVDASPFSEGSALAEGGAATLLPDSGNRARFALYQSPETLAVEYAYRPDPEGEWVDFESPFVGSIEFIRMNDEGTTAIFQQNDMGSAGIVELNLETKEFAYLSSHDRVTVTDYVTESDNAGTRIVAAWYEPDRPTVDYIEPDSRFARLHKRLQASFPDAAVDFKMPVAGNSKTLMRVYSDRQPSRYFLLDVDTPSATYLFDSRPQVDAEQMGSREAYWVTARDGIEMQVYVTFPPGYDPVQGALPTVINPHGGPFEIRDSWAFDAHAQLIASQGYAVIQPNFRGSGGRGDQFVALGQKRWGREMQDDITDVTYWAYEEGISDPARTCIYGWSYGGYATLAGIVREPELYACAFAMAGVYDLPLMERSGDIRRAESGRTFIRLAIGDDREDMIARSPAYHVENIVTPLFVAQGRADMRVPLAQYESLLSNLDEAGIPYDSLLIANEGHTLYAPESWVAYFRALLGFLDEHIGPESAGKAVRTSDASSEGPAAVTR